VIGRPKGISLLVPTQNAASTVELCLRSFANFADEVIIVDNGSTDDTPNIVRGILPEFSHFSFCECPEISDLSENRQYALEQSTYNWVARIDSDYIAYTEGPQKIENLRDQILNSRRTLRPTAFAITQVELFGDFEHVARPVDANGVRDMNSCVTSAHPARIIQRYPGMQFQRRGRWEGVRFQHRLIHKTVETPYWFHCQIKSSNIDLLLRSERTNWRGIGDFRKFPTVNSYVQSIIEEKYGTADVEEAAKRFIQACWIPQITRYSESAHYPYPRLIREAIEKRLIEPPWYVKDSRD